MYKPHCHKTLLRLFSILVLSTFSVSLVEAQPPKNRPQVKYITWWNDLAFWVLSCMWQRIRMMKTPGWFHILPMIKSRDYLSLTNQRWWRSKSHRPGDFRTFGRHTHPGIAHGKIYRQWQTNVHKGQWFRVFEECGRNHQNMGYRKVKADVIWAIRRMRPDVVINRFDHRTSGETHGHHTASAQLSYELFDKAADKKIILNIWNLFQPGNLKDCFLILHGGFTGVKINSKKQINPNWWVWMWAYISHY